MTRTKNRAPGRTSQKQIDKNNEKKRKREGKRDYAPTSIEADDPTAAPSVKRPRLSKENARKDVEVIPSLATEKLSPEEQPAKGSATTVSESAPPLFGDLANLHDVLIVSAISSSKIQKKTTAVLKHLAAYPAVPPAKPALVLAHSKADTTAKLITIIEIAKRDIGTSGGKWFQYNVVYQVMEQQKEKEKKKDGEKDKGTAKVDDDEHEEGEDDEDEQLETMKTPFERAIEGQPKVRAIPHMAIYLSRIRIESLGKKYG